MRRKVLVVVGSLAALAVLLGAAGWWSVQSVPDWYEGRPDASVESPSREPARESSRESRESSARRGDPAPGSSQRAVGATPDQLLLRLRREGRVELDAGEVRGVVVSALDQAPDGRPFLAATRSLEARLEHGHLEVGGLLDLSRVDEEALSPDGRDALAKLRRFAPFVARGERYVGVRGEPVAVDGKLTLAPGATVQIGKLGLPVEFIAGLSGGDQDGGRPLAVALEGLRVTRAAVIDERLVVEAEPSSRD